MAQTGCCVSAKETINDTTVSTASHHPTKLYNIYPFPLEFKIFMTASVAWRWTPRKSLHKSFFHSSMMNTKWTRKKKYFLKLQLGRCLSTALVQAGRVTSALWPKVGVSQYQSKWSFHMNLPRAGPFRLNHICL